MKVRLESLLQSLKSTDQACVCVVCVWECFLAWTKQQDTDH